MPDLELIKGYLRIDGSEDDRVLTLFMNAAINDLKQSGVPDEKQDDEIYDLAVLSYVALYYENRDPSMKIEKLNAAYQNLILKLKN